MGCWVLGKMDIRTKEYLLEKDIRLVNSKKIYFEGKFFHGRGGQALAQAAHGVVESPFLKCTKSVNVDFGA